MQSFLKRFEHVIVLNLITMMVIVVVLATIEPGWIIVRDITTPPVILSHPTYWHEN